MIKKNKKLSYRQLEKEIKSQNNILNLASERNLELQTKIHQLERASQYRVDQSMIEQRIKLANSLGQMIEATSKAIMFIIGKETL